MKTPHEVQVSFRFWLLPVLLGTVLVLAILFPYKGWWIILLALGLAWAFSYYSIYHFESNLKIQREMRYGWAHVGDVLEERITIVNQGPLATPWMEIEDHTNIPGHTQAIGTNVGSHSEVTWQTRHTCSRRGLYRLGPTTLKTSDLFGFYRLVIHDPKEVNILILPPVVSLPVINVATGGRTGDGHLAKGNLEPSVAVSTVREYQPNDPLHHIHWPLSAKHDHLTSRVFENTPTGNWWIIQDMNKTVQTGSDRVNSLEVGILLSASLANKGLQSGRAVGFVANNLQCTWIAAQHTGDQMIKILRDLAISSPADAPLFELLELSRRNFTQPASLIIITPDTTLSWWEPLIWLKAKGMIPTVLMLDPASFGCDNSSENALRQLHNARITAYSIQAEMFADQFNIDESPPWEWRVFGTGQAVPIKKPSAPGWKRL